MESADTDGVEDADWAGSINKVTSITRKSISALEDRLVKKLGKQQSDIQEVIKSVQTANDTLGSEFNKVVHKANESL